MNGPKLIDAITRLFDEMVRDPWSRPGRPAPPHGQGIPLEVQVPVAGGQLGEVAVVRDGDRLTVRARVRGTAGLAPDADMEEGREVERVVTVPAGTEVDGIEARFENEVLHVRITLRAQPT
jgi:HSP20 family molecular chaperone IbpA